jgi:hypothetical protein
MKFFFQPLTTYLLVVVLTLMSAHSQDSDLRGAIFPDQPMWLISIDTGNYPDSRNYIDLFPVDGWPFVVMNLSLSKNYDETGKRLLPLGEANLTAESWLRTYAENGVWAMVQQTSDRYHRYEHSGLTTHENFLQKYPGFIGFNYAEQYWDFNEASFSSTWMDCTSHFADLLSMDVLTTGNAPEPVGVLHTRGIPQLEQEFVRFEDGERLALRLI